MIIPANLVAEALLQKLAPPSYQRNSVVENLNQALGSQPVNVFGSANPNLQGLPQVAQAAGHGNPRADAQHNKALDRADTRTFFSDFLNYLHKVEGKGGDRTSKKYDAITFPGGLTTHTIKTMGQNVVPDLFDSAGKLRFKNRAQAEEAMKAGVKGGGIDKGFWDRQIQRSVGYFSKNIPNWATLSKTEKIGTLSHMWNLGPNAKFKSLFNILKAPTAQDINIHDIKRYITNSKSTGEFRRGTVNRRIKDINNVLRAKGHRIITKVLYEDGEGGKKLTMKSIIRPKDKITIPGKPDKYVVQKGDTLGKIAKAHKISLKKLLNASGTSGGTKMTFVLGAGNDSSGPILNDLHNKKNRVLEGTGKAFKFTEQGDQTTVKK